MDDGEQSIEDHALREQLRRQARWIAVRATLAALVVTAVAVALP